MIEFFKAVSRVLLVTSLLVSLLTGCSDDVRPEPAELVEFEPKIELKRLWKKSIGVGQDDRFLQYEPFVMDNNVYAVDYNGLVHKFGATFGVPIWTTEVGATLVGGISGNDEQVYVTTYDGELIALKASDGKIKWQTQVVSEVISPAVAFGQTVVVKTVNGKLAAYNQEDGEKLWEYASNEPALTLRGTSRPVVMQDAVISGMSNGTVTAVSGKDGQLFWEQRVSYPKGKTELERLTDVDGQVVVDGSDIFAVAYQGELVKMGLYSGQQQWSVPISSRTTPGIDYQNIYVSSVEGDIVAFDKVTQKEVWRQPALAYRELTAPVVWDSYLVVGDLDGYLHVLSKSDGEMLARIKPAKEVIAVAPVVYEDRIIVMSSSGEISAWAVPGEKEE